MFPVATLIMSLNLKTFQTFAPPQPHHGGGSVLPLGICCFGVPPLQHISPAICHLLGSRIFWALVMKREIQIWQYSKHALSKKVSTPIMRFPSSVAASDGVCGVWGHGKHDREQSYVLSHKAPSESCSTDLLPSHARSLY